MFTRPTAIHVAWQPDEVVGALRAAESQVQRGLHAAGFVAYEAAPAFDAALPAKGAPGFPLLWLATYPPPRTVDPLFAAGTSQAPTLHWEPSVSEEDYGRSIQRIKAHIEAGDTYQVNYSLRLRTRFWREPWAYFAQLMRAQQAAYGAYIDIGDWVICSASPELFFRLQGRELTSRPMKGTAARGLWYEDDCHRAAALRCSEKDQAENVMIVDMVRNDMGRIADLGSVRVSGLFEVEQYPTVWQMTSTVRCETGGGLVEIFRALFPPASITGAPKRRTMQIIEAIEDTPRRIYTGSVGFITPERRAQFNVAIRTVLIDRRDNSAEYGVGGGIVWDSDVTTELRECRTKARVLTHQPPEFSLLETMLWTPANGLFLLRRHLARLRDSARYFAFAVDFDLLRRVLDQSTASLPLQPHRVRLTVSHEGVPAVEVQALAPHPRTVQVGLARNAVDSSNPFLYHKTTHREVYARAMSECPSFDDLLLWNADGEVTESCVANIIFERDGEWLTPPVRCGLLPGTYRSLLLEQGNVKEGVLRVEELAGCPRIWLVNSVRGMCKAILSPNAVRDVSFRV